MEMSGQGLVAAIVLSAQAVTDELQVAVVAQECGLSPFVSGWTGTSRKQMAMARTPALPPQDTPQTSPSKYPMWCFHLNCVEKSPWPHLCLSSPFTGLYLGDRWPYRL